MRRSTTPKRFTKLTCRFPIPKVSLGDLGGGGGVCACARAGDHIKTQYGTVCGIPLRAAWTCGGTEESPEAAYSADISDVFRVTCFFEGVGCLLCSTGVASEIRLLFCEEVMSMRKNRLT